jgi:hypothetical protein
MMVLVVRVMVVILMKARANGKNSSRASNSTLVCLCNEPFALLGTLVPATTRLI